MSRKFPVDDEYDYGIEDQDEKPHPRRFKKKEKEHPEKRKPWDRENHYSRHDDHDER